MCQDVLDVLDESLIPKAESGESKVFYHKMYVLHRANPGVGLILQRELSGLRF